MTRLLETLWEWCTGCLLQTFVTIRLPEDVDLLVSPELVYEKLYEDGVRNWGRKVVFVTWLRKVYGPIKGFFILYRINQTRLR